MADIPPENVYPFRDAIERDIKKMKRQIASDDQSASSKNQQQKRHALEDAASGRRTLGDYARSNMNRLENANRTIASISVEQGQESLSEKASSVADILKSALESATPTANDLKISAFLEEYRSCPPGSEMSVYLRK